MREIGNQEVHTNHTSVNEESGQNPDCCTYNPNR